MQRIFFLCLVAVFVAGVALAEDFWVAKEYMQWTDEEVKKLMTNSPWAKDVTISAPMAAMGRSQRTSPDLSTSTAVETGGTGGRRGVSGGGAVPGGGSSEALITLNISWRSALPLKKALVRSRLGSGASVPAEAAKLISDEDENYVVVVTG